jgi:hypothetical protein
LDVSLNCREAARLVSEGEDRPLSDAEAAALKYHLSLCLACGNFERQLRFLKEAVRRFRIGDVPA